MFPPTYEGGQYATEERIDPQTGKTKPCVLLDSVQSQANRMELALLEAHRAGKVTLPLIVTAFDQPELLKQFTVTSLEAPHRIADALFRDSRLNGEMFRESDKGRLLDSADVRNATGLFGLCPTALVFGLWDSTGRRGGLGAKFQRALVSEIVGYDAVPGVKTVSRIDPAQIALSAGPLYERRAQTGESPNWTLDEQEGKGRFKKTGRPSEAGHGNVTPAIFDGGFTISKATQTTVLSLAVLRRLRFPPEDAADSNDETDLVARTALAALGLAAGTLARCDVDLRSRCHLFAESEPTWKLIDRPGTPPTEFALSPDAALQLLADAIDAAAKAGLPWEDRIELTPSPELVELVLRSQEISESGERGGQLMFALCLRYLNGWSMAAADGARKELAEWPPHPDRAFMALAAAWFETGVNGEEGEALRWLESLPPPAVAASDASQRSVAVSYVPVNDSYVGKVPSETTLSKLGDFKKKHDRLKEVGLAVLPEYRVRHPRGFPVAIPACPVVRLIWREELSDAHRGPLERLSTKVTHVGHSASFVQAWVEQECEVAANLVPTEGIVKHRLRVPSAGSLDRLARTSNHAAWIAYHDLRDELERAQAALKAMKPPPRVVWRDFPDAVLLADETRTKRHPSYAAAKGGDVGAATNLVHALADEAGIAAVRRLLAAVEADQPVLVSAHAYERNGFNAIPAALAKLLSQRLGAPFDTAIVQTNVVGHTGAGGYGRLARQAAFGGEVEKDRKCSKCMMVDDFIGQGGTLANLRGWVEKQGGRVVGAVGLTGKPYSAKLNPSEEQLHELRQKHGPEFEKMVAGAFRPRLRLPYSIGSSVPRPLPGC